MIHSAPFVPPALAGRLARGQAQARRIWTRARRGGLRTLGPAARRTLDLLVSCAGLAVAGPLIGAAALAVQLQSPGPILFRQVRVGLRGQPIVVFKLRTMYPDAEQRLAALQALNESVGGVTFKIRKDPRIVPVGRILRKLSIDELPQLWNVLNGSMTLFGPRPPLPREVDRYGPRERRRLEVKPGLTCLWQVSGRSDLTFEQQVSLDLRYIDTCTALDDAVILAKTIPAVISGKGAY